jgi:flagellar export protein FliJ
MQQIRQCWTVLANKAEEQCERIQQELVNIQQRLEGLQANEQRLRHLYAEYQARLTRPGVMSQGMQDAIGQRQFMQQITDLIDKVLRDQAITQQALKQTRARLAEAQREKHKMEALVENDLKQVRAAEKKQELKLMDELALRQFNVRQLHGHA